jgi:hypothetical protein
MGAQYIVHWKDVVGHDFYNEFARIAKMLIAAGRSEYEMDMAIKSVDPALMEQYGTVRDKMRFCGYEYRDNGLITFHGWFRGYFEGGQLKFRSTTDPNLRKYINYAQFLHVLNTMYGDDVADDMPPVRTRVRDDDFIPEEESA